LELGWLGEVADSIVCSCGQFGPEGMILLITGVKFSAIFVLMVLVTHTPHRYGREKEGLENFGL
jgi:hypothetical protein